MKKFLSLVLAVIMTMSLVTISASAAEYKDFTDRDEIQYEEAVAVLNRLGIITGYSEGDFRPEGELTRGAAAKIIASLLIGPEAAENLSPTTAPFKDVPLDHTFAGPIAYCSTLKIINGYNDGSFQPGGTLTGYAFSKMLLGALGYDGDLEGFTGAGWNMNVMRLGGEAGLFDRISFKGNEPVNREQAAQLALNTLKGTLVEYSGGLNIVAGDASVTSKPTRIYKTSNQEYAQHILNRKASEQGSVSSTDALYTVEFGEEHFVDLRMTHDRNSYDDFGRPSNEWSYKKVTIGTFPIEADKTYTEQVAHDVDTVTNASKARSLGLTGFEVKNDSGSRTTSVTVNGKDMGTIEHVGEIANYTDNGTVVEVYVDEDDADFVKDVVVIKTQLMEVKRLGKDAVSLELYDGGSANKGEKVMGFNQEALDVKVDNVEVDDSYYTLLSGLKVGDRVAVVPVTTDDGKNYTVAKAYVPENISGALKKVSTYGTSADVSTIGVTVGDTAYDVALWNKDLVDIDGQKLDVTTKDVTLTLDEFGNALLAEDVGATSDFMIVGSYYQNLVNGKLTTYVKGWDISGEELNLNLGSKHGGYKSEYQPGDLVHYTNATTGDADWTLSEKNTDGVFDVAIGADVDDTPTPPASAKDYAIKASNTRIQLKTAYYGTGFGTVGGVVTPTNDQLKPWVHKNIKFIYVTFNEDGDVDSINIKNGVQAASHEELIRCANGDDHSTVADPSPCYSNAAQAALDMKKDKDTGNFNDQSTVKAVVIKNEANDAVATNMLYIVNYKGGAGKNANGDIVYEYTVAMNGSNGLVDDEMTIYSTKKLSRGDWARYTEVKNDEYDNFYALSAVDQRGRATSTMVANFKSIANGAYPTNNKALIVLDSTKAYAIDGTLLGSDADHPVPQISTNKVDLGAGDNNASWLVSLRNAIWVDLTGNNIDSYDDLADLTDAEDGEYNLENVKISMIFNDDSTKDAFRQVAMAVVQDVGAKRGTGTPTPPPTPDVAAGTVKFVSDAGNGANDLDDLYIVINGATYFLGDAITADSNGRITIDPSTALNGVVGTLTLTAGTNTTIKNAGVNKVIELTDKTKGGTVNVVFAPATYDLDVALGSGATNWTLKTDPSDTGIAAGTEVTIVLEQKNNPAADTAAVDTAIANGKITLTGLNQTVVTDVVAKISKQGKAAVAADPATDQWTTLTPTFAGANPTAAEITAAKALVVTTGAGKNSSDGKLYFSTDSGTTKTAVTDDNFDTATTVTGMTFYAKIEAGSTTAAAPAVKGEVTITFTMPAANVSITDTDIDLT